MTRGMKELKMLGDELDIDEAAALVLQIPNTVGADFIEHSPPHGGNIGPKLCRRERLKQNLGDGTFNAGTEFSVAGDHASSRHRQLFPCPRRVAMIGNEARDVRGYRALVAG